MPKEVAEESAGRVAPGMPYDLPLRVKVSVNSSAQDTNS